MHRNASPLQRLLLVITRVFCFLGIYVLLKTSKLRCWNCSASWHQATFLCISQKKQRFTHHQKKQINKDQRTKHITFLFSSFDSWIIFPRASTFFQNRCPPYILQTALVIGRAVYKRRTIIITITQQEHRKKSKTKASFFLFFKIYLGSVKLAIPELAIVKLLHF